MSDSLHNDADNEDYELSNESISSDDRVRSNDDQFLKPATENSYASETSCFRMDEQSDLHNFFFNDQNSGIMV